MLSFDDHHHSQRMKGFVNTLPYLHGHAFLHLQAVAVAVYDASYLGHRKGGRWQLAPELLNCGLAEERLYCSYSLKGKYRTQRYLVWTPEGVRFLDTAVRKLPRKDPSMTSVQLNIVFNS